MSNFLDIFRSCKCQTNYDKCKKLKKHKCICSPMNKKECRSKEHECICINCILGQIPLTICKGGESGQHQCTCFYNPHTCMKEFVDIPYYPSSTMHVYGVHHTCVCKRFENGPDICKRHNGPAKNKKHIRGFTYPGLPVVDNIKPK